MNFDDKIKIEDNSMEKILSIDVGGTFIKYGFFDSDYVIYDKGKIVTPKKSVTAFLAGIQEIINKFSTIDGLAVSLPGFVDAECGHVRIGGALSVLSDTNVKELLSNRFSLPVAIENDARCATLAELTLGNLKDVNNGAAMIFGTGIGAGIVIDRKIIKGNNLCAGEISYLSMDLTSNITRNNFFSAHCSIGGIAKEIEKYTGLNDINGIEAFKMIKAGNKDVEQALKVVCHKIAMQIYQLQFIIDAEKVVIGGGISAEPLFIDYIKRDIAQIAKDNPSLPCIPQVEACYFGNDANLLGALLNFEKRNKKE